MMSFGQIRTMLMQAFSDWNADNATRLAAAVAFYSILSIAPLVVMTVSIAGLFLGDEAARGGLVDEMRALIGTAGADVIETTLANAKEADAGIIATVVGLITLLFGASGVFVELRSALNTVWDVRLKPGIGISGFLRSKLLSFGMVLAVGFLLLVSLVLSAALSAFGVYLNSAMPGLGFLVGTLNFAISVAVVTGLFALIFKYLPDVRMPWRDVWLGALTTALLFTVGKSLIGLYLGKAAVATPFGAAGSLVAVVVWVYYSSLIVFYGAELTQIYSRQSGSKLQLKRNAEFEPDAQPGRVVDGVEKEAKGIATPPLRQVNA